MSLHIESNSGLVGGGVDQYPPPRAMEESVTGKEWQAPKTCRKLRLPPGARVQVEMDYLLRVSVLAGTAESGATEVRSDFEVDSEEDENEILNNITHAKRGCFA